MASFLAHIFDNERFVRSLLATNGEPWFVAADSCRCLDLKDNKGSFGHHLDKLDEDEKRLVPRSVLDGSTPFPDMGVPPGQATGSELWMVNESGLYTLILRSDKATARPFRRWVTHNVLPSLRKTGGFTPVETADLHALKARTAAANAIKGLMGELRRTLGSREAAKAAPGLMASIGVSIDSRNADCLRQGELALPAAAGTAERRA